MVSQTNLKQQSQPSLCWGGLKMTERPRNQDVQPAGPPEAGPTVAHTAGPGAEVTVGPGHMIVTAAGRHPAANQTLKPLKGNRDWKETGRNIITVWRKPNIWISIVHVLAAKTLHLDQRRGVPISASQRERGLRGRALKTPLTGTATAIRPVRATVWRR